MAYSPLGRGFLTGTITSRGDRSVLDEKDFRLFGQPRFSEENFDKNLKLLDSAKEIAANRGVHMAEVALAWLYHAARHHGVTVIPIPGTSKISNLQSNLKSCSLILNEDEIGVLNKIVENGVVGDRYAHMTMTFHGNK